MHNTYIKGIDGLRAIAVLSVVFFHLNPNVLPGGFTGVDIFFVISGYVVSLSLSNYKAEDFKTYTTKFYARRLARLTPSLIVCIFIAFLLSALFIPQSWLSSTATKTGLLSLWGIGNLGLIWLDDGYFSPRAEFNIFSHTWSLGVEEQFYALFPFLFYFIYLVKNKINVYMPIVTILALSLILCIYYSSTNPTHSYYSPLSRWWELLFGVILFLEHSKEKKSSNDLLNKVLLILGVFLLIISLLYATKDQFPFPWALPSVIGSVLVINGLVDRKNFFVHHFFENNVLVYIGKISYSLYLIHWPIIVFFKWTIGLDNAYYQITAFILSVLCAVIIYQLIELKVNYKSLSNKYSDKKLVLFFTLALIGATITCLLIAQYQSFISLSTTKNNDIWYPGEKLTPFNTSNKSQYLYVIGDSHAGAYLSLLNEVEKQTPYKVKLFSMGGCGVISLTKPNATKCKSFVNDSLNEIKSNSKAGDVIFFASLKAARLSDQWASFDPISVSDKAKSREQALNYRLALKEATEILDSLFDKNNQINVIIDSPKPLFASPPYRCSDWFNRFNPVCKRGFEVHKTTLTEINKPVFNNLDLIDNQYSNVYVWNVFDVLCPKETCSAFDGNTPLYFDGDHLSGYGNRKIATSFIKFLNKLNNTEVTEY